MKLFNRFIGGLLVLFILLSVCYERTSLADTNDQSVQAFERMTDEYMKKVIEEYKVAGVAVSVVKGGKEFFKKGYGYADVDKKELVNPDTTAFEIASVSKLFTATAAMQLVNEGKLSLDEDVNKYLKDFKIKNDFSKPVTLRMLLTHTAGFDDKSPMYYKSKGERFFDYLEPLGQYLEKNMPPVVREPGAYWQYSVYGYALIGHLIEEVTGTTFDKYVGENILKPLQMNNSSYGLNKDILKNVAKPYRYNKGEYLEGSYTLCANHPSDSIYTTALDMTKFMIMHVNNGEYNGVRLLKEGTVEDMQKAQYLRDEKLIGFGYGFLRSNRNGFVEVGHAGYLPGFSSRLSIMPEKNIGMFITINTDSKDSEKVCKEFTEKFYDFFIRKVKTGENSDENVSVSFDMDNKEISGSYAMEGYPHSDLLKIKSVIPGTNLIAKCDNKGNLTLVMRKEKVSYKYIGNGVFYSKEENDYCKVGKINNKMILSVAFADCEKVSSGNIYLFHVVIVGVLIFLITNIMLLISLFKNRKLKDKQDLGLRCSLVAMSFLVIIYMVLNVIMAFKCMTGDTQHVYSVLIPITSAVCYLVLGTVVFSVIAVISSWVKKRFLFRKRVFYSIIALLGVIDVIFMYIMNGFKLF